MISEERLATTRRIHLHLGVVTGLGMALDILREVLPPSHPLRMKVFAQMLEITEANVTEIVAKRRPLSEDEP